VSCCSAPQVRRSFAAATLLPAGLLFLPPPGRACGGRWKHSSTPCHRQRCFVGASPPLLRRCVHPPVVRSSSLPSSCWSLRLPSGALVAFEFKHRQSSPESTRNNAQCVNGSVHTILPHFQREGCRPRSRQSPCSHEPSGAAALPATTWSDEAQTCAH
jgi:hypothetical protein